MEATRPCLEQRDDARYRTSIYKDEQKSLQDVADNAKIELVYLLCLPEN